MFQNQNFAPTPSNHSNYIHPESKLPPKRKKMHAQTRFSSQHLELKLKLCRLFIMEVNVTVAQSVLVIYSAKWWYKWISFMTESWIEHVWLKRQFRKATGMTGFTTAKFSESTLLSACDFAFLGQFGFWMDIIWVARWTGLKIPTPKHMRKSNIWLLEQKFSQVYDCSNYFILK